jgi:tetratricopeptide (TPR) repeat protein
MASARKLSGGRLRAALKEAQAIASAATKLGYPPVEAESLQLRGELEMTQQELALSQDTLQRAVEAAKIAGHDAVHALASIQLAHVARQLEGDPGAADSHIRSAEEVLKRHQDLDTLHVLLHSVKGLRHLDHGDTTGALESLQQAIVLGEKRFGATHHRLAGLLSNMAEVYRSKEEYVAARELFRRSAKILKRCFGKESPQAAAPLAGWAQTLLELDEVDKALKRLHRQLDAYEQAYGEEHGGLAKTHSLLGKAYGLKRDFGNAIAHHDRAVSIASKAYGERHWRVGRSLCYRGVTRRLQHDHDKAQEDFDTGLKTYAPQVHPNDVELAWFRTIAGPSTTSTGPMGEAGEPLPGVASPRRPAREAPGETGPT